MTEPYLEFDLDKVWGLKQLYETNQQFVLQELPKIDWNSPIKLKKFFKEYLDIDIKNARISTIASLLETLDHDSEAYDIVNGVVCYLRIKYTIKNYLNIIIGYEGCVPLREINGKWFLCNKRPIPTAPELAACIRQGETQ